MARRVKAPPRRTGDPRLPGDLSPRRQIARMLRVDQAGEYGAVQIYKGQLAVLGNQASAAPIRRMAAAEAEHLAQLDALLTTRAVRPTMLQPLWRLAGFALGAGTALIGPKAAMACTVAVEEVIDEHYARQVATLGTDEAALRDTLERFRRDEVAHGEAAKRHGAEETPGYRPLTAAIKAGSRLAIWLSERL